MVRHTASESVLCRTRKNSQDEYEQFRSSSGRSAVAKQEGHCVPLPSPPSHDGSIVHSTISDSADSCYDRSAAGLGHTTRSFDRFRSCYVFALACQDGFADRYIQAGVAQWQSSGFVNRRLEVQFLSPAPYQLSVDQAALHRFNVLLPQDELRRSFIF